jgi:hypothetical protein
LGVYPPSEVRVKLEREDPSLGEVMAGPRVFLTGNERGLERLAEKRSANVRL